MVLRAYRGGQELPSLFDLSYEPKWDLYDKKVSYCIQRCRDGADGSAEVAFRDPLNKFEGIKKYQDNIQMLKVDETCCMR